MPRAAIKDALVATTVSAIFSIAGVATLFSVRQLDLLWAGLFFGTVLLYGAGLLFALHLAIAGWVVHLPKALHHVPWVATGVGQPAILVGSILVAVQLRKARWISEPAIGPATVWLVAVFALVLLVAVARRRSGRWSVGGMTWMTVASAAWAVAHGSDVLPRWWPRSDLGYALAVASWHVMFSPAYVWWAWPRVVPDAAQSC